MHELLGFHTIGANGPLHPNKSPVVIIMTTLLLINFPPPRQVKK